MYISRTAVRMLSGCSTVAGGYPDIGEVAGCRTPTGPTAAAVGSRTGRMWDRSLVLQRVVWPHQTTPGGTR